MNYSWARYYQPGLSRFVSEDPLRFQGGPNFYVYANDTPTRFRDPRGLDYGDINVSWVPIPFIPFGFSGGVMWNQCGIFPYIGGGPMVGGPGPLGGSLTWSDDSDPSPGPNTGYQFTAYWAWQSGHGPAESPYSERGHGWPLGASATLYYVFRPFGGPFGPGAPPALGPCPGRGCAHSSRPPPPDLPPFIMP